MQYTKLIWRDAQPYSEMFDDIYYSSNQGEEISGEDEFNHVFFKNNGLPERWQTPTDFVIAELGFGSGLNCLLTIRAWLKHLADTGEEKCLHYIAIEKYPLAPEAIIALISRYPELKQYCDELIDNYPPAIEASHRRCLFDGRVVIHYQFMDVMDALENETFNVDAWYLDGFSPAKNADMWTDKLFLKLAQNSHEGTSCSTYTAAGFVKRNLMNAGFEVMKVPGYGRKRDMLVASYKKKSTRKLFNYREKPWFHPPAAAAFKSTKATVIGAGIAGLCVAYALVKRGWQVTLIDRHDGIAKETSSNPVALVYPRLSVNNKVDTDFYIAAYCHALYALDKLQDKRTEKLWLSTGLLQLMDEARITEIMYKFQFNEDAISITDIATNKAASADTAQKFIDIKNAGVVIPDVLCAVIKDECGDRLTIKHADVEQIKQTGKNWQCLSKAQLIDESEVLVVANGISLNVVDGFMPFPVESVRGQVVSLRANLASKKLTSSVNAGAYLTPVVNGQHYLGASYTRENDSAAVDDADTTLLLSKLADKIADIMPAHVFDKDDCVDAWVGFRAMSQDRVPIVGAVPDMAFYNLEYSDICNGNVVKNYLPARYLAGLYVTAAHGSRGFTSSFLAAEIIASLVESEPLPVAKDIIDYLSPSRFIVNDLKRR